MNILAIETSCDETSVAILSKSKILINLIASQIDFHKQFGGVIPEYASRMHAEKINTLLAKAYKVFNFENLDYIAYTEKPGLIGALQVGKVAAQALSIAFKKELIPINHLHGHIFAGNIDRPYKFPILGAILSGGHTQLVLVNENLEFKVVAQTRDDAIGEVFDKVAIMLGYQYPGGPHVEKLAKEGEANIDFPIPMKKITNEFSFSGLKTAVRTYINKVERANKKVNKADVAASFQKTAVASIIEKTKIAIKKYQPKTIVLGGGVAANNFLRDKFIKLHKNSIVPKFEYCTDNAAMIAKFCEVKLGKD